MGNQTLPAVNAISVRIFEGEVIHAPSRLSRFVVGYAGGGLPGQAPVAVTGITLTLTSGIGTGAR